MKTFAVSIPTKSYLRKYLHKRYGYPIPLNHQTLIGTAVLAMLEKKIHSDRSNALDVYKTYSSYNDKVQFVVPASFVYKTGHMLEVPSHKAIVINRHFEGHFEEELYAFCQREIRAHRKHPGYDQAYERFAARYGIEFDIDITYEALKKMEYRFRKKLEQNLTATVPASSDRVLTLFV